MIKDVTNVKMKEGESLILLKERVEVTCTETNPFEKKGKKVKVHPLIAEKGIKNGFYEPLKTK